MRRLHVGLFLMCFVVAVSSVPVQAVEEVVNDITESVPIPELVDDLTSSDADLEEVVETVPPNEEIEEIDGPPESIKISKVQVGEVGNDKSEFVELYNSGDTLVDLRGIKVISGARLLADFAADTMVEPFGTYVLAHASYVGDYDGEVFVTSNNASGGSLPKTSGSVTLSHGEQLLDAVTWGEGLMKLSSNQYAMARCQDSETNLLDEEFALYESLMPHQPTICAVVESPNMCSGLVLNEVGANLEEQFIELYNTTNELLDISDCGLKTNRASKVFSFENIEVEPGQHLVFTVPETGLTLTKTTVGEVFLLGSDSSVVDSVSYEYLKSGTSFARFDDGWYQTYKPTPGEQNLYEVFAPCAVGWYRAETGYCRKVVVESTVALADCGEGKYRNPETNRCKSITSLAAAYSPCADGYYRNPETNRCKKIATESSELKPCQDGYERNPETNRCRKIRVNNGADFGVAAKEQSDTASFVGWLALGGVAMTGLTYVGFEFRHELVGVAKKTLHIAGKK